MGRSAQDRIPTKKWSRDEIIEYLNIYRKYECLWDISDTGYVKKNCRYFRLKVQCFDKRTFKRWTDYDVGGKRKKEDKKPEGCF